MPRRNRRPYPVWRPTWIEVVLVLGTALSVGLYVKL